MQADAAQEASHGISPAPVGSAEPVGQDGAARSSIQGTATTQPPGHEGASSAGPPLPSWLPGGLAAAGIAILVMTLMRAARRRAARRRDAAPLAPPERLASLRSDAEQRDQLTNLMVDVEELTRRFAAQLDNKAARLEILLAEANETIQRLETAMRNGAPAGGRGRSTPIPGPDPQRSRSDPADLDGAADPITREVYRLADEGCSAMEIARRLEQHTGKVELILALRNV